MPQGMDPKGKLKGVVRHNHEWNSFINRKASDENAQHKTYTDKMIDNPDPARHLYPTEWEEPLGRRMFKKVGIDLGSGHSGDWAEKRMASVGKVRAEVSKELGDRGWGRNEFEVAKSRERYKR